ncbi:polyprenyl synthetase family protein [Clostridium saccharobutylicum]|uniref:Farnesyl diphosphate synthase n=1 Tax=Clostridium saccharobutylicum DSM 13864 TaxID=1345695 RepID=U5MVI6_CLOSA|nr:farnesyl diphosphate synthase [Clostridium saccharobutylicum]AGX43656.1 farnesyl diphosphate synthase IspA [Clostridium saccharobutylicum DSM 13864]MBC2403421.1 polyprenyl synthetase family protein [Clostridium saccharobutylicum]MBC2414315.1 polyprenyl synthetase family protein [Clostridium saccharobutylicum]MBC2441822.1 polyprenyl synthetase family protein [Clostridium saccharobutylicum]MBC2446426.1 polyprenyl synthetase family protein [Clostridium saccharobutylicum]
MEINNIRKDINEYLENYFKEKGTYNKVIYDSSSYSLNIGGKRIRPILFALSYFIYREEYKSIMPMACAMEMIHTYSLIHDDLPCMDDDDLRRGKPTNHKVYGENIAVLAGDNLLNEAMILMMNYSLKNGGNSLRAAYEIAKAAGAEGMIGGQVVDIISEGKEISKEELEYMHSKKTGALIKASILGGAILAGAPERDLEYLEKYGEKLGLVFQIKDDILDVVGDIKALGKNVHADEEHNKTNFITVYGLEKCQELCSKLTEECVTILRTLTVDAECLVELTYSLLNREN